MKNFILFFLTLLLIGCSKSADNKLTSTQGVVRNEEFCNYKTLKPSLRDSIILIDANILSKTLGPKDFLEKNIRYRDLILNIADPYRGIASGAISPREKISLYLLPSDGSAAKLYFSGCIPGLTKSEIADLKSKKNAAEDFVKGDPMKSIEASADEFRKDLVVALMNAAKDSEEAPSDRKGKLIDTATMKSLHSSGQLLANDSRGAKRIFLISDLSSVDFDILDSSVYTKSKGIEDGKSDINVFRYSELILLHPVGKQIKNKDYLKGYLTGQGGILTSISATVPNGLSLAPQQILSFVGKIQYPIDEEPVEIIIGDDGQGKLTSSWFVLMGFNESVTPMRGSISCSNKNNCVIKSDGSGFAQVWKGSNGSEPEFKETMPLVGARNFSFQLDGSKIEGKIGDERVQLGHDSTKPEARVTAIKQEEK